MMLPPISAIGTCIVELYGPPPGHYRWGAEESVWDTATWTDLGWQDVTPESMNAKSSWGASNGSKGVLAVAEAGTWNISTYDPDRLLDPANPASPFSTVLHPGSPVRIRYVGGSTRTVKSGLIDTIDYSIQTQRGAIRATDRIAGLVAATIPAGTTGAPTTLRALARWAIAKALIPDVTVEADPPEGDPTIGAGLTDAQSVWQWLGTAALDCLHAVWLDPDNVIRFRSFGAPRDLGLAIGGDDGIPLSDMEPSSSLDGVYSRIIAYDTTAPTTPVTRIDDVARNAFGDNYYERTRPVPNAGVWADNVLADRSGAALQYNAGTLRPRTEAEILALLDTGMVDVAHIVVDSRDDGREVLDTPIEASATILGGSFEANTLSGWSASLVSYIGAGEWKQAVIAPPPPPPPPPATQTVTRTYVVNKDTRAARDSGGTNLGSGTEGELPVGAWAGWRNRAYLAFAAINWSDVISLVSAELRLTTTSQVNIGFGSNPKIRVRRLVASWSEGSASSPSGSNATVYPGPGSTSTGEAVASIPDTEGTLVIIPITNIAKAWAPAAAGGSGAVNYGLQLLSYAEDSTTYTTEFWAREHGTSTDAEIRITVKIPA